MKSTERYFLFPNYRTQTEIGTSLGLSAIEVGHKLAAGGMKEANVYRPTTKALQEKFVKTLKMHDGTPYYVWETLKAKNLILSML